MKSKAANTRDRNAKQTIVQPPSGGLMRAVAGAVSGAAAVRDDSWRNEPFKLDRAWMGYAGRYAFLIVWTFVASVLLAGVLPSIFAQAFQMPVASFPEVAMSAGTFLVFALIRAGLALRIVDHVVRVPSVGKWVLFSVLSDAVFQFVLLRLLTLSPLAFSDTASVIVQFVSALIGSTLTGWLQWRMFTPKTKSQLVWVAASILAWLLTLGALAAIVLLALGRPV
jgi:hypothetical protein